MNEDKWQVAYNDRYFRIVLSIISAHIIVMYNDPEGFFSALFTVSYLRGFIASFIMALLLTQYIYFVTVRLDKKYDWHTETLLRLLWQFLIAFIAPAFLTFLMVAFFFRLYGINIFSTDYLLQDYPLVIIMLLAINIYYFGLNSFLRLRHANQIKKVEAAIGFDQQADFIPEPQPNVENDKQDSSNSSGKEILVIDTFNKSIPLRTENISYCFILSGVIFLREKQMESINDSYQLSGTLKTLEDQLDRKQFFRINRQMIVNFSACKSYSSGRNKTLELVLDPPPYNADDQIPSEHLRLHIVSEDRVAAFKDWMDR